MDERWASIWDGGVLKIFRSWTGICYIRLVIGDGEQHELQVNPELAERMDPNELWNYVLSVTDFAIGLVINVVLLPVNMIPAGVTGNIHPIDPDYRWDSKEFEGEFVLGKTGVPSPFRCDG